MPSIKKRNSYKKSKKQNKKQSKKLSKKSKKKTKKNVKKIKVYSRKRRGGNSQTFYWSPMRKIQYNSIFENQPRQEITSPVYNCRNPITVVQTGGQNSENVPVQNNCPYQALGASSFGLASPAGLSNGLILENNTINGGGKAKTSTKGITKVKRTNSRKIGMKSMPGSNGKQPVSKTIKNDQDKIRETIRSIVEPIKKELTSNEIKDIPDSKNKSQIIQKYEKIIQESTKTINNPTEENLHNFFKLVKN